MNHWFEMASRNSAFQSLLSSAKGTQQMRGSQLEERQVKENETAVEGAEVEELRASPAGASSPLTNPQ